MAKTLLNKLPTDGALSKHLPQIFKTYPSLDQSTPSSYFMWSSEDPTMSVVYTKTYCHSAMPEANPGYDNLITAVPKSDDLSLDYQRMLIHGPFRALSDLISLESKGDNYYLRCSELDKWPANVLYNFCMASRIPIEKEQLLPHWGELVLKGFDPTLAFLLSYSTGGQPWQGFRTYPWNNHLWFSPASNWLNIIRGEMLEMAAPFKEHPRGSRPCNIIWGKSDDHKLLSEMPDEDVSAYFKLPVQPPAPIPERRKKTRTLQQYLEQDLQAAQAMQAAQVPPPQAPVEEIHVNPFNHIPPINWPALPPGGGDWFHGANAGFVAPGPQVHDELHVDIGDLDDFMENDPFDDDEDDDDDLDF